MWHTHLEISERTKVEKFNCKGDADWCYQVKLYLETEFKKSFINFKHEHGFDQPTAMRQLLGVVSYINHFNAQEIETMHPVVKGETLAYFFNCNQQSI